MSYQTVTDIIAGSQKAFSYEQKNFVKASFNENDSQSFEKLVSFYKNENKSEKSTSDVKESENKKEEIQELKKEDIREDSASEVDSKENVSDENNVSKNEESQNVEEETVNEVVVSKSDSKDSKVEINSSKIEIKDSKEIVSDKEEKNPKAKKNKKLSNKDFSRIEQIGEKNNNNIAAVQNNQEVKSKKEIVEELEDSEKIEIADNAEKNNMAVPVSNENSEENSNKDFSKENSKDDLDFNLSKKSDKKDNTVFLDKDKKITVTDLRTENVQENNDTGKSKLKVSEPKLVNENTAQITMELNQNANANVLSSNSQSAAANGSNFQAMLNNQIQQSAPEFVKAGNLILKDNNQGTINLVLRPDDLGNVKLHLSLDGKNISGHITVATKEALEVFKDNAETLREAFIKSGFDSASFDVAYNNNGSFSQEMDFNQQQNDKDFIAKKVYGKGNVNGEGNLDKISEKNDMNHDYSINIVA